MATIYEMMVSRKTEILSEIKTLSAELADIERMLASGSANVSRVATSTPGKKTTKSAIIEAIKNNIIVPKDIVEYLKSEFGMTASPQQVRTSLSRMKKDGILRKDTGGWLLA